MKVTKVEPGYAVTYEHTRITNEELQREYDFLLAEQYTKKLLDAGLITEEEHKLIRKSNIRYFKPLIESLELSD